MSKYLPWATLVLLVVIAYHVRASFEYNGFAKSNLVTPKPQPADK